MQSRSAETLLYYVCLPEDMEFSLVHKLPIGAYC